MRTLTTTPVLRVTEPLKSTVARKVAAGDLVRLLPGVVTSSELRDELAARVAGVAAWNPDAVVTGMAAARLTWWEGRHAGSVDVLAKYAEHEGSGYTFHRGIPDPEWIVERNGVRLTNAAFTAVWLAAHDDGLAIDNGLRLGAFRLDHLHQAMAALGRRHGNKRRREVLQDSRHLPWSPSERRAHRFLRLHKVEGWKTNHRVIVEGRTYYLDIAFPEERIAVEIDGHDYHTSRADFQKLCDRHNALTRAGWKVLHLTASDAENKEYLLANISACRG